MYTKGEWKLDDTGTAIYSGERLVANCGGYVLTQKETLTLAENKANAHLIVAAVNACTSVNPDNPLAVAESIKDMYEALKLIYANYGFTFIENILAKARER